MALKNFVVHRLPGFVVVTEVDVEGTKIIDDSNPRSEPARTKTIAFEYGAIKRVRIDIDADAPGRLTFAMRGLARPLVVVASGGVSRSIQLDLPAGIRRDVDEDPFRYSARWSRV